MFFWSSVTSSNVAKLKEAEDKLLSYASTFGTGSYKIETMDTPIPRSAVPLKPFEATTGCDCGVMEIGDGEEELNIHAVKVSATKIYDKSNTTETPLVLLHGYMNAAAYFYRNLVGLSDYYQTVYSVDMLGWGLSSRPSFDHLVDDTLETAEDFFVESLEAWRAAHNIERLVLAGHSMGGYVAVAYCERYPERVEKLLLLSPIGVPDENDPSYQERRQRLMSSIGTRAFIPIFQTLFESVTVGSFLRSLPSYKGQSMALGYVEKRLPEISDPDERQAVANYLYYNNMLPGSGEYMIQKVLNPDILAKKPLQFRIPKLKLSDVIFMYGTTDWMEVSASLSTKRMCDASKTAPETKVFIVRDAGHLLILQNWHMANAVVTYAGGGSVPTGQLPIVLTPGKEDLSDSTLRESVRQQQSIPTEVPVVN